MRLSGLTLSGEVLAHCHIADFVTNIGTDFVLSRLGSWHVVCAFLPVCLRCRWLQSPELLAASATDGYRRYSSTVRLSAFLATSSKALVASFCSGCASIQSLTQDSIISNSNSCREPQTDGHCLCSSSSFATVLTGRRTVIGRTLSRSFMKSS